jgi:hypothetical protein
VPDRFHGILRDPRAPGRLDRSAGRRGEFRPGIGSTHILDPDSGGAEVDRPEAAETPRRLDAPPELLLRYYDTINRELIASGKSVREELWVARRRRRRPRASHAVADQALLLPVRMLVLSGQ